MYILKMSEDQNPIWSVVDDETLIRWLSQCGDIPYAVFHIGDLITQHAGRNTPNTKREKEDR